MPQATKARTTWIWFVVGLVVVGLVGVLATGYVLDWGEPPRPSASSSAEPEPTSSPTSAPDISVTGCLGGDTRDAAMVLRTREQAPRTTNGAVEVAAAFVRWLNQFPYPSPENSRAIEESALASEAPTKEIVAFFESEPNLSGGLVPDRTPYNLSTVAGVYYVESASPDSAVISVGTSLVEDGVMNPSLKGSITVTLAWEDGGWKFVSSEGTRTTEDLFAMGRPFSEGC